MSANRIYQNNDLDLDHIVTLDQQASHHLLHVLRLKTGSRIILFNGNGHEYGAEIEIQGKSIIARITAIQHTERESPAKITLVQGISRGDRMDRTIQKAVELGVSAIVPVACERSIKLTDTGRIDKKYLHWRNIIISACEQSGRCVLPQLSALDTLTNYLAGRSHKNAFVLDPYAGKSLTKSLRTVNFITVLIGPEGGLSDEEYAQAETAGFIRAAIGPRILRTETAGMVALSIIQTKLGDLK